MLIGLTYDLRSEYLAAGFSDEETAEFDRDDTIVALEKALGELGHSADRIGNAVRLAQRLVRGDRWELVFNIAEGLRGIGREAQVPVLLDLYGIPYTFSDPLVMALTLHKGMTKRVIRDAGLPTPEFFIAENISDAEGVRFPPPYFVKPLAEGTSKGISAASLVVRREDLIPVCNAIWGRYRQPALVERYLPGREFTVGIWGTGKEAEVIGTLDFDLLPGAEAGVYSYLNKEQCEKLVRYRLPPASDASVKEAEAIALGAWRVLGCRDAGRVDLRCDEAGKPCFLEVNPLAGLHPTHSDLPILCALMGIPYLKLIERILSSALSRTKAGRPPPSR